jgi:UDP-glucose 4-epimerase
MEDPWTDLDVNLRGTLVLLEALRTANPKGKVVFAGSRLQYGRPHALPVAEDADLAPTCLHAVHKSTIESYLGVYQRLFGLRSTMARITNPYGPGQPASTTAYGVINQMIHRALAGQTLTIYGDGAQLRDYLFIDDLIEALLRLGAASHTDGRIYNVGSGHGTSLVDLARLIIDLAGDGRIAHVAWPELAARIETGDFVADVSRLAAELDWRPATTLPDGLARTIAFYRARVTN